MSEQLTAGKSTLERQMESLQKELEELRCSKQSLEYRLADSLETQEAIRQGRRVVEAKLHTVMVENEDLCSERAKSHCLSERVSDLEANLESMEQEAAIQASLYESKIAAMQAELNAQLDAVALSKKDEADSIKARYMQLFDEKATEAHDLRSALQDRDKRIEELGRRLTDQEYQEQELRRKFDDAQTCHHEEIDGFARRLRDEMAQLRSSASAVDKEMCSLRAMYDNLQLGYLNAITRFKIRPRRVATSRRTPDGSKNDGDLSSDAEI